MTEQIDHLNAHPGEAFTTTRITRMINRSTGVIANALATLAKQGLRPRHLAWLTNYAACFGVAAQ
ncbi:hypothetical protein [Streptomyces sp. NPDC004721]